MKFDTLENSKQPSLPLLFIFCVVAAASFFALPAQAVISKKPKAVYNKTKDPQEISIEAKKRLAKKLSRKQNISFPLTDSRIVINKSKRKLYLYNGKDLIKTFKVALGKNPNGQKEHQGDYRTPEGTYYIANRNDASNFHLFMGLNYPAKQNAEDAYQKKLISKALRDQIVDCEAKKQIPPWNTVLGGAVGIHGIGVRTEAKPKDWTWGCIALRDQDIEELWVATKSWTPVTIQK